MKRIIPYRSLTTTLFWEALVYITILVTLIIRGSDFGDALVKATAAVYIVTGASIGYMGWNAFIRDMHNKVFFFINSIIILSSMFMLRTELIFTYSFSLFAMCAIYWILIGRHADKKYVGKK